MSAAPSSDSLLHELRNVPDSIRWNIRVARYELLPDAPEPLYLGAVPQWRFTRLLADSTDLEQAADWYNAGTGHGPQHRPGIQWRPMSPGDAVEDVETNMPESATPHIYASWDGEQVKYETRRLAWERDDDVIPHIEERRYRGTITADREDKTWYEQAVLVPPGTYGRVDHRNITEGVADVGANMLRSLDEVSGRIPETFFSRKNGDISYREWDAGRAAAHYWEQYLADDLHILSAEAAVQETRDMARYSIRVEGVPAHRYTGQDEGLVVRFWSEAEREHVDAFQDLLHR